MCGIVGSFSMANIALGFEHIKQRGTKGFSLSAIDSMGNILKTRAYTQESIEQAIHEISSHVATSVSPYYVLHAQSPTGLSAKPHPAVALTTENRELGLWHNGMLNSAEYRGADKPEWDTQILARDIAGDGFQALSTIEGTFACIAAIAGLGVFYFRNIMAPLYWCPVEGTLSSVPFRVPHALEGPTQVPANHVFLLKESSRIIVVEPQVRYIFNNDYNPLGL